MILIATDLTSHIVGVLRTTGHGDAGDVRIRGVTTITILGKGGKYTGVVGLIHLAGTNMPLSAKIDEVFQKLKDALLKAATTHGGLLSRLVIQGGGSIALPEWFAEWCKKNNIELSIYDESSTLE